MHTRIIVTELTKVGFEVKQLGSGVLVSLNRPVSQMEVETALEQAFEGIRFQLSKHGNSVFVQEL